MNRIKLLKTLSFILLVILTSCSKDENEQNDNTNQEFFTYDGIDYDINGSALQLSHAYSFELEKEVISGFTLVFIDGEFYENSTELITTNTTRGVFVEIDLEDYVENINEIDFSTTIFDETEGAYFDNITIWEDEQTIDGKTYGFPDEFDEVEIVSPGSLSFSYFEIAENEKSVTISCSYSVELENGKLLNGTFSGISILGN